MMCAVLRIFFSRFVVFVPDRLSWSAHASCFVGLGGDTQIIGVGWHPLWAAAVRVTVRASVTYVDGEHPTKLFPQRMSTDVFLEKKWKNTESVDEPMHASK